MLLLKSNAISSCFGSLTYSLSKERSTIGILKFDPGDFVWISLFNVLFLVLKELILALYCMVLIGFTITLYKNLPVKC